MGLSYAATRLRPTASAAACSRVLGGVALELSAPGVSPECEDAAQTRARGHEQATVALLAGARALARRQHAHQPGAVDRHAFSRSH